MGTEFVSIKTPKRGAPAWELGEEFTGANGWRCSAREKRKDDRSSVSARGNGGKNSMKC